MAVLKFRALTERVIGLAIEVHRMTGPGLLESFYTECLCAELEEAGIPFASEVTIAVVYKSRPIPIGFGADIVVDGSIMLEIKAVGSLLTAKESQILTYLHTSGISVGLLMNFHAKLLKDGLMRFVV